MKRKCLRREFTQSTDLFVYFAQLHEVRANDVAGGKYSGIWKALEGFNGHCLNSGDETPTVQNVAESG